MRWIPCFLGALAVLANAGCGIDTDPTIFVDVTVVDPTVRVVSQGALGTEVSGGFTLALHLGARAAGSSDVAVNQFDLVSEDQNTLVAEAVPLAADGQPLPIVVEPGTDEDVDIYIDLGSDLLAAEVGQKLCSFNMVRWRGSLSDSLRGTTIPVLTEALTVTGCNAGM